MATSCLLGLWRHLTLGTRIVGIAFYLFIFCARSLHKPLPLAILVAVRLAAACAKFGFLFVAKLYFVPYWINVMWLDVVTYLHHTDKEVSQDRSTGYIQMVGSTCRFCSKASVIEMCDLISRVVMPP